MPHMNEDYAETDGAQALINAAQLELARIYGAPRAEHKRTKEMLAIEVEHFGHRLGWSPARIALKLRMSKADVAHILAGAA